jgi:hypothetical protein
MSAVVLMEIAVQLVIQMEYAVVMTAILCQDVDALITTAELVRAMEILVIVTSELSTATEPVWGYVQPAHVPVLAPPAM